MEDDEGYTPLDLARKAGYSDAIVLLEVSGQRNINLAFLLSRNSQLIDDIRSMTSETVIQTVNYALKNGVEPFAPLPRTAWLRYVGPQQTAALNQWISALKNDKRACFVALFEGSGRDEGGRCLIPIRCCTSFRVNARARLAIISFLVSVQHEVVLQDMVNALRHNCNSDLLRVRFILRRKAPSF